MFTRVLLWGLLLFLVVRAVFRFFSGVIEGGAPPKRSAPASPQKGEMMARDPVCGTFVVPSRAVSVRDAQGTHYFCSEKCRAAYRAK